jgi:hypothetical protein
MLGEHVIQRQGLITEQGYEEQPQSYRNMGAFAKSASKPRPRWSIVGALACADDRCDALSGRPLEQRRRRPSNVLSPL